MNSEQRPAPLPNSLVPRWAILAFAGVFLSGLLVLPFAVYYGMARTQNQSHGMNLAMAARLPFEVRDIRPTSRENPDAGLLAARYEIPDTSRAKVAAALSSVASVPGDLADALAKVAPKEPHWTPDVRAPGPWFAGSGTKNGLAWRALYDGTTGVLWIVATPEM